MNKKHLYASAFLFLVSVSVLVMSCNKSEKRSVTVDYKMSLAENANEVKYFTWTYNGEKVEDKFDVAAQASMHGSTKKFNNVRYSEPASEKKLAIPTGLRGLFLYAVASDELAVIDNLTIMEDGGVITIRYIHRGTAYELMTDKNGMFDVLTGGKIAKGLADNNDNKFTLKPEFLKEGGDPSDMSNADWSKINLDADKYNPEGKYHYEGSLKFEFKDNVLSVSGTLTEM